MEAGTHEENKSIYPRLPRNKQLQAAKMNSSVQAYHFPPTSVHENLSVTPTKQIIVSYILRPKTS